MVAQVYVLNRYRFGLVNRFQMIGQQAAPAFGIE
jgi:hypothetical protein